MVLSMALKRFAHKYFYVTPDIVVLYVSYKSKPNVIPQLTTITIIILKYSSAHQ